METSAFAAVFATGDGDATACPSLSCIFGFSRWGMLMLIDAYDYDSVVLAPILPAIPGVGGHKHKSTRAWAQRKTFFE